MTVRALGGPALARTSVLAAAVLAGAWPSRAAADGAPEVKIEARGGAVVVESDAAAATILVGDRPRGAITPGTSLTITLPEGTHRIAIEVAGHERYEHTIEIRRGKTATLRATLAALPPPNDSPPARIALTSPYDSPYDSPPARIEPMSPYGSPPARIELTSPYDSPPARSEPTSPYGSPPAPAPPRPGRGPR